MTDSNDDPSAAPVRSRERDLPADRAFVCDDCGTRWYYDRRRCPDCGRSSADAATVRLETGTVVATTTVETTPPDVRAPNHLALVRFDGVQVTAQAADGDLAPGDTVRFEGSHRLRESRDRRDPRLVAVDDD
ncbi:MULTISPECIES: hypothetical protein [Halorubrum]|uniref:DUF35 domain-containing protein n=1 Tax=Halorubrum hochstenium ATCC 700873 TaxID=1227481 RepID=M0F317_9EURY|nr:MULTISPECIES: hypothetical protein [Halorubrum]ELZ54456.1 hypothetical protein C467_11919 [Halorubrum hochstenium ATCC 700873]